jgi:hypothetical protein
MGVYYSTSSNIAVFPTTKRESSDRSARLLTEQNLVDIVNRLLDVKSFVITKDFNFNGIFEFNIYGYFFRISNIGDIINGLINLELSNGVTLDSNSAIYANIHTFTTGDYEELYGSDENGMYDGVIFTLNDHLSNTDKWLKILDYSTGSWNIPIESLSKFIGYSINPIDCGEI